MTRYDRVAGHPLAGVPQEVLLVARSVLETAARDRDVDPELTDELGDAVVQALHEEGYLTWPQRVPDREALILAVMDVQYRYAHGDDESRSLADRLVDELVLPLARRLGGGGEMNGG